MASTWTMEHMDEERVMHNGMKAKIIGGKSTDLAIQFEDGTIIQHTSYRRFKDGAIANPNKSWVSKHIGEERVMSNGMKAKIIGGKCTSLTIQFEDGTIRENVSYVGFEKGAVKHHDWIDDHKGEEKLMKNGMKAKIIGGSCTNITVEFEDGVIRKGIIYSNFIAGSIAHPSIRIKRGRKTSVKEDWIAKHLGEQQTMGCGVKAKIKDGLYTNLTIEFEDGTTIDGVSYNNFKSGHVSHPLINLRENGSGTFGTFELIRLISKEKGTDGGIKEVRYECKCKECGFMGELTPQEMLKHEHKPHETSEKQEEQKENEQEEKNKQEEKENGQEEEKNKQEEKENGQEEEKNKQEEKENEQEEEKNKQEEKIIK